MPIASDTGIEATEIESAESECVGFRLFPRAYCVARGGDSETGEFGREGTHVFGQLRVHVRVIECEYTVCCASSSATEFRSSADVQVQRS